jgi:hypothetical protein
MIARASLAVQHSRVGLVGLQVVTLLETGEQKIQFLRKAGSGSAPTKSPERQGTP